MYHRSSFNKPLGLVLILLLMVLPPALTQKVRCDDDNAWTFGRYRTMNGKVVIRTCAWVTENPILSPHRRDEWCNARWRQNIVKDKCPETCFKKECIPPIRPCADRTPFGNKWHDSSGEEYTCKWYSYGDNCNIFGYAFRNFGWTAQEACCVCGGGRELPNSSNEALTS